MTIRTATSVDIAELANLYAQSVQGVGATYYITEQVQVWSSFASDTLAFQRFIEEPVTFLAEEDRRVVGFTGIAATGHVSIFSGRLRKKRHWFHTIDSSAAIRSTAKVGAVIHRSQLVQ